MAQSQSAAAAAVPSTQQAAQPAAQTGAPAQTLPAPQVLDERLLGQVTGGLPRVGGW